MDHNKMIKGQVPDVYIWSCSVCHNSRPLSPFEDMIKNSPYTCDRCINLSSTSKDKAVDDAWERNRLGM